MADPRRANPLSSQLDLGLDEPPVGESPKLERVRCTHCARPVRVPAWLVEEGLSLHFCNARCRSEWKAEVGAGVSTKGRPSFRGGNWETQAGLARERDRFRCVSCGVTEEALGRQLDVHHIVPYRMFGSSEEANRLSNLISLCSSCHAKRESEGHDHFPLFGSGASDRPW